jgi:capsular polysaccharide biosynthesis protein
MELNELFRRIVGQHWKLIALCFLAGVGAALALQADKQPLYSGSARIALDAPDPESRAEAVAIADTVKAIATSPTQVEAAMKQAGITGRDPVATAEHHVGVSGLGSSGVVELSVSDRDQQTAIALTNALAAQVIRARLTNSEGKVNQALSKLDLQIKDLDQRIAMLEANIRSLDERLAGSLSPQRAESLGVERDQATKTRASLLQQQATVETQRSNLLSGDSLRPNPTIISRASPPAKANPSELFPAVVLGGFLGLILGVGIAGLVEVFRPTLVGPDVLAREFQAPLLGVLPHKPGGDGSLDEADHVAGRLHLAADGAALRRVALVAAEKDVDIWPLAERLQATRYANGHPGRTLQVQPFLPGAGPITNGSRPGLVVVLPTTVKKADLAATQHLLATGRLPLLGIIAYEDDKKSRTWGGHEFGRHFRGKVEHDSGESV